MHFVDEIIDREEETNILLNDIANRKHFTINILHAPTAVGKSSVTNKLSQELRLKKVECIVVRTNPINKTALSDWTFLSRIFDELRTNYTNSPRSFYTFLNSNSHFRNLIKKSDFNILKDINKENMLFKPLLMHYTNNYDNAIDYMLENENLFLYAKLEYINYVFSLKDLVIIIDNLQIIDDCSLDYLKRCFCFNCFKKHYVIFEYTELQDSLEELMKLSDFFVTENIVVKSTKIANTDAKYLSDIIDTKVYNKPSDFQFNINLNRHYLTQNTGNIRELIDYTINYTSETDNNSDQTIERIINLSDNELFILFALLEFDGYLEKNYISSLTEFAEIQHHEAEIDKLLDKKLIDVKNNAIIFSHASITDSLMLNNERLTVMKNSTKSIIKSYIEKRISHNTMSVDPFLKVLLKIYKATSPKEIPKLFKFIEESIVINLQPLEAWGYFSAFIDATIDNVSDNLTLYIEIFKLCFKFELYHQGYSCLEKIYSHFPLDCYPAVIIYRMLYLAALDRHEENIDFFIQNYDIIKANNRLYLNACLAVLSSYRSLGRYKECFKIHNILKQSKFKGFAEYGYRNRLVDMYLSRKKSIKYLNRSIRNFKDNPEQLAKSLITYTHVLGGLGKVKKAEEQIKKAEVLLESKILGRHMLLVNKAVLSLISGNFSVEVL